MQSTDFVRSNYGRKMERKKEGTFAGLSCPYLYIEHLYVLTICHGNYRTEVYSCMNFSVGDILQGLLYVSVGPVHFISMLTKVKVTLMNEMK